MNADPGLEGRGRKLQPKHGTASGEPCDDNRIAWIRSSHIAKELVSRTAVHPAPEISSDGL